MLSWPCASAHACGETLTLRSWADDLRDSSGDGELDPGELVGLPPHLLNSECSFYTSQVEASLRLLSPAPGVRLVPWPARAGGLPPPMVHRTDPGKLALRVDPDVPCATRVDLESHTSGLWAVFDSPVAGRHAPSCFTLHAGETPGPQVVARDDADAVRRAAGSAAVRRDSGGLVCSEIDEDGKPGASLAIPFGKDLARLARSFTATRGSLGTALVWLLDAEGSHAGFAVADHEPTASTPEAAVWTRNPRLRRLDRVVRRWPADPRLGRRRGGGVRHVSRRPRSEGRLPARPA